MSIKRNSVQKLLNNFQSKTNLLYFKDIIVILLGIAMSSLGMSIFYAADLGSAPLSTFSDGVHNVFSVSYGAANIYVNIVLLVALLILKRSFIGYGTILCVFATGLFINLFSSIIENINISDWNIFSRIVCTVIGTILIGVGLGLYVAVDKGLGPLEGIVIFFCNKTHLSFSIIKIIQDVILVVLGIIMGGQWGVGTLIATLFTGPILQKSIEVFQAFFNRNSIQT